MPRDPLEPVYRLVASSRFLEAINMINKLLKKQPNFLVAKIWKCEALYGLGNIRESEELMASIISQGPSDKRTLEIIADFLRARGDYAKLVEVYENALKSDPNDETCRKSLFECCGLSGEYKKQQQQALLLYKQSPRMLFYCMAVVCLLQQADENPVALELAERMMTKQFDAGKIKAKNEILLLLIVFEKRGKVTEALALLEQSADELESLISVDDKKIELLAKLKRLPEAVVMVKKILTEKADSWAHYKQYLQMVLELESLGGTADNPDVDDSRERALTFLLKQSENNPSLRGPILAQLELINMLYQNTDAENLDLLNKIISYFKQFGDKAISVFDLRPYIILLPNSTHDALLRGISETEEYENVDALRLQKSIGYTKHASFLQVNMILGKYCSLSVEERLKICSDLIRCFNEIPVGSDRRDQYLVVLAAIRKSLFYDTDDAEHLIAMVCQLEDATLQGSCVFSIHVLLMQFYFALGATKAAKKYYEQLRIQSVQVDTLSHMFLVSLSSTGHFTTAMEMWDHALRVLHQCTAESLGALLWCYRSGLFHRVEEFTQCARRFQKTLTVPYLRGEKAFLEVITAEPGRTEQLLSRTRFENNWDSFVDNRDVNIMRTDPANQIISATHTFQELLLFCKIRETTLQCVLIAITHGKERQEEDPTNSYHKILDDLQKLHADAIARRDPIHSLQTRLHIISHKPLPAIIEKLLESEANSIEKVCVLLKQTADDTTASISGSASKNPRKMLEIIVSQLEMLAMVTVVCGAVRSGLQAPQRRRNEQVVRTLVSCWTQLESCLPVQVPERPSEWNGSVRDSVEEKLRENYQLATDDMKKVVRKKITYLHKLLNP